MSFTNVTFKPASHKILSLFKETFSAVPISAKTLKGNFQMVGDLILAAIRYVALCPYGVHTLNAPSTSVNCEKAKPLYSDRPRKFASYK